METILGYLVLAIVVLSPVALLVERVILFRLLMITEMLIIDIILSFDEIKNEIIKISNIDKILFSLSSYKQIKSDTIKPPPKIQYIIIFSNSIIYRIR
ncbi:MAG: hypothetical protein WCX30_03050 [Candidatus Paceibacterota bacterium]|jgi:hypothetical protein|nr:hypothetical protein [bacterium]